MKDVDAVFILIDGKLVPFFIEDIHMRVKGKDAVIKFEDINNTEKARELCSRKMYLPIAMLPANMQKQKSYQNITSYKAYTTDDEYLGVVEDVIEYPNNPVLRIMKEKREILIPAAEEFIRDLNHKKQSIILDPPAGLLDLYR